MKKIIAFSVLFMFVFSLFALNVSQVEAKRAYYKSAKSGRFTTKSYSSSHKSTTYKSYYKR